MRKCKANKNYKKFRFINKNLTFIDNNKAFSMKYLVAVLIFLSATVLMLVYVKDFQTINIFQKLARNERIKPSKDSLSKLGVPDRILNQYMLNLSTKKYNGKSFFIVDTRENLIFFFDKKGNFVAKSPTIDGFAHQSREKSMVTEAFKKWSEHAADIGFKWDKKLDKFVDSTEKNRNYSHRLVYNQIHQKGGCFFPKGLYVIPSVVHNSHFVGSGNNTYNVRNSANKNLALAIHGLYKSEYRIKTMNLMIQSIKSNFNQISVPKSYRENILRNINNNIYNNSYGCINVPEGFIQLTEKHAAGSLLFVLGEEKEHYLVEN